MITIDITRYSLIGNSVIGYVQVIDEIFGLMFECFSLEPKDKIIPKGKYDAFIRQDHEPNRIQLKNVPQRNEIQIHQGNSLKDTVGCILIGNILVNDWLVHSVEALNELLYCVYKHGVASSIEVIIEDYYEGETV